MISFSLAMKASAFANAPRLTENCSAKVGRQIKRSLLASLGPFNFTKLVEVGFAGAAKNNNGDMLAATRKIISLNTSKSHQRWSSLNNRASEKSLAIASFMEGRWAIDRSNIYATRDSFSSQADVINIHGRCL